MKTFEKESREFARVLQAEHISLGALLQDPSDSMLWANAGDAHEAVKFQKLRVEAAHGVRK